MGEQMCSCGRWPLPGGGMVYADGVWHRVGHCGDHDWGERF